MIGCNGLYRDFLPDAIVAVDKDISREVMERCPKSVIRLTHQALAGHPNQAVVPLPKEVRNACADSAGVTSVAAAIALGARSLCLIGHDLDGAASVYHGTANVSTQLPSYRGTVLHWARTLEAILEEFPGEACQVDTRVLPVRTIGREEL